jgi:hypothetical protein
MYEPLKFPLVFPRRLRSCLEEFRSNLCDNNTSFLACRVESDSVISLSSEWTETLLTILSILPGSRRYPGGFQKMTAWLVYWGTV